MIVDARPALPPGFPGMERGVLRIPRRAKARAFGWFERLVVHRRRQLPMEGARCWWTVTR
jgi:hypothetical protein